MRALFSDDFQHRLMKAHTWGELQEAFTVLESAVDEAIESLRDALSSEPDESDIDSAVERISEDLATALNDFKKTMRP